MSTIKNAQIFRIFTIILAVIMFSAAFTYFLCSVTVMLMERVKPARSLQVRCMYALVQALIIRRSER